MATTFQSCPGCTSLILSDTAECPECGHVFDETRAKISVANREQRELKNQQMYDTCRNCGEQVRSGLVRCFNCNAFMRADVEARYKKMQSTPQQIIFSDIPQDQRTEYLDAEERAKQGYRARVFDADINEFSLRAGESEFQLSGGPSSAHPATGQSPAAHNPSANKTPAAEIPAVTAASANGTTVPPNTAATNTNGADIARPAQPEENKAKPAPAESATDNKAESQTVQKAVEKKSLDDFGVDDLVGIALQDQKETRRRKRDKIEEARKRRILLPCSCGAWVRVREDQTGRVVRCTQCKKPMVAPVIKKKEKSEKKDAESTPQIDVKWFDDLHMHLVVPTQIKLTPGSLKKSFQAVDVCVLESGVFLIKYSAPRKRLFGKNSGVIPNIAGQKQAVRQHVQKTGTVTNLPHGELFSIAAADVNKLRLVQPVANAHESMFAGVSVFGESQIAIYLPLELPDGKQAYLSFPLSTYRGVAEQLEDRFDLKLGAEDNGVPATEEYDTLKCFLSEARIESLKNVSYYQIDPAYELEVSGFICGTCGSAITEEARARKKLGGAKGKGLPKAKCPKCSNKFGPLKAWKITKAPKDDVEAAEDEEDVSEVLRPKKSANATGSEASGLSPIDFQGTWRMVSVAKAGNFAAAEDMKSADISFEITGNDYNVSVGGKTVEAGTLKIDLRKSPAHMDQHVQEGADKGKKHLGLVRFVDGKLQNCQGDIGAPRPTTFDSSDNKAVSLAIFERA